MNICDVAEISIIDQDEVVYGPVGTVSVLEVDVLTKAGTQRTHNPSQPRIINSSRTTKG